MSDPAENFFPDDTEVLPEGSVVDGAFIDRDLTDSADYVVIGSGAAGATAALVLSSAGLSVIILEEGPWVKTRDFGVDVYPAMKSMFREMGTSVTMGRAMFPVLQGRCVGGSTTINSAIAWRAPERVVHRWNTQYGLQGAISFKDLEAHFDELDRTLTVRAVEEEALGGHNRMFAQAALKLGIRAERIKRYDGGCVASASCLTGCQNGKKLSMNVTHVPRSLRLGARIYTSTRAVRVESRHGRAGVVHAVFQSPSRSRSPHSLKLMARRGVVLAASAVQTPGILRRSGVRLDAVGRHFQAQPGTSLSARFDRVVSMQSGATQGFNSMHFVDSDRFKIEALSLPPEMLSLRIPGIGTDLMQNLLDYRYTLNWAVVVRAEAEGRVRPFLGKDVVQYTPLPADMARMRRGLRVLSEMMFAAGAREIWPNVHGMPTLKSPDDLRFWEDASLDPRAYGMMISHLFGSARMGPDARNSVVGLDFQVHGIRGLYVLDSSIFPTNLGVNPQHTIMAVSRLGATRIAERPLPANG